MDMMTKNPPADHAPIASAEPIDRGALRAAFRQEEAACVADRLRETQVFTRDHAAIQAYAVKLIQDARKRDVSGIDAFLHQYGLNTEEGIALMCLAEALLRVPDGRTADALIRDKIGEINWREHLNESDSTFVNAATFSLMLTGEVLERPEQTQKAMGRTLRGAMNRLGEPVIRQATFQAMRILGGQFVFGRTINEALKRAGPERARGLTHSFDMLGEAAMTFADAERYRKAYLDAIERLKDESDGTISGSPGISVKLTALYPKYDIFHAEKAKKALIPIVTELAVRARDANIHFTIDAEEADRLELSLDIIEALAADDSLFARPDGTRWEGFGMAVQAYQKRGVPLCRWLIDLAEKYDRKFMVRLVKGAYWDTEIKISQVAGLDDFPVFTRKVATDVSYMACADVMLSAPKRIYGAFATHNAYTIAAIVQRAGAGTQFEFQRLHGMGEELYAALAKAQGNAKTPVRIYAPVGGHKDLLAYLVRRLLENGANSSFVNRMADSDLSAIELAGDPVAELAALEPKRNPAIPLPKDIFPGRRNSAGVDLADPLVREPLLKRLHDMRERQWEASPTFKAEVPGEIAPITAPFDHGMRIGTRRDASAEEVDDAIGRAAAIQPGWNALGGEKRALLLEAAADAFEAHTDEILSLCQLEAGKTLVDAVLEIREAVDFLRYYANEARRLFIEPTELPGPTGEHNYLKLAGRGVFATISPWNFPLAIFIGPAAAALAAGNTVIAKPAEQTPLIAALAVKLCHQAGIPEEVFQLLPGGGEVGQMITSDVRIAGVSFTGSTQTAQAINRGLAARDGGIATLIAETGGQNAMIVDSTALPEQVTRDVISSAFQSAGQRCSAQRVLYIQEDVYDEMLTMIRGAFEALDVGDPTRFDTDVGPVIDHDAQAALERHIARSETIGRTIWRGKEDSSLARGSFVVPTIIEIEGIGHLQRENFGPVLHIAKFKGKDLGQVVDDINAVGFGLTCGLHSRVEETRRFVESRIKVGNFYVNRNQIGAVVGSQPFGGEGLSGTGPKAGGPNYVARFATERVVTVDTTAAGGNATLLASL
ncbi:integrase [Citromicrobium sp. RCC1885]|uniref:bifunctional proline dehydrogenase/L-glutamate gamma-semialdehyde dehydrogenase PutA n=1 Tax=unclassified Citromicrobium TaxID=2630544 RepID=UPI0006C91AED|nr:MULTISPECIES: bifunctional proline dehydrogenase/L-glutamate gamma-semialdehyde dehydrogenase PutA [unclassified Citromicrobium]KPM24582.1 integrase [Citromicrobium sp. RCC1885]KPM27824.1 integrase [Citromicrobium sp. RCC1878]OAM10676.1 bifunctional proline dehydrogenase/L-glutamate gamma-semialdehyde dehydrogenase [Citromicrobium sp. RCC1897]|tara:strand:- start:999 stop:4169 length:3171 start_codon:yes stop_codon:yes gene_type:complete